MYPTQAYKKRAYSKGKYHRKGGAAIAANSIMTAYQAYKRRKQPKSRWVDRYFGGMTTLKTKAKNFARKLVSTLRR